VACTSRLTVFSTNFSEQMPLSILLFRHGLDGCVFAPNLLTLKGDAGAFFSIDYSRKG
jgi:hypothetical protein